MHFDQHSTDDDGFVAQLKNFGIKWKGCGDRDRREEIGRIFHPEQQLLYMKSGLSNTVLWARRRHAAEGRRGSARAARSWRRGASQLHAGRMWRRAAGLHAAQTRRGGGGAAHHSCAAAGRRCAAAARLRDGRSAHCPAGLGDCPAARSEMRCTRSAQYTGRERIRWREMKRWGNFLAPGFRGCPAGRSAFFPTDCGMSQKLLPTPLKTL